MASTLSASAPAPAPAWRWHSLLPGLATTAAWALASISAAAFEDVGDWSETAKYAVLTGLIAVAALIATLLSPWLPRVAQALARRAP